MDLRDELKSHGLTPEELEVSEKVASMPVMAKCHGSVIPFPSTSHRHVFGWWLLEDGTAVGLNESPRVGLASVRAGRKKMLNTYPELLKACEQSDTFDELVGHFEVLPADIAVDIGDNMSMIIKGYLFCDGEDPTVLASSRTLRDLEVDEFPPSSHAYFSERGRIELFDTGLRPEHYSVDTFGLRRVD